MMSLFWYYRPEHTQGGRDPSAHCEVRIGSSSLTYVKTNNGGRPARNVECVQFKQTF